MTQVHAEHADFVWRSLLRLGVREADAEDMLQNVFIVVHRRKDSFDGSAQMTTWLFGICRRVAAGYRRRSVFRFERDETASPTPFSDLSDVDEGASPEAALVRRQAQARLAAILDTMDMDKRAVFVMFEIDELPCTEIAELLGVPQGTVYSRLHAARRHFDAAVARFALRDATSSNTTGSTNRTSG